ncbi:MAG: MarR family winged helix-turn-helix transcriptional regulator [Gemmatimonadaceae bacterium]
MCPRRKDKDAGPEPKDVLRTFLEFRSVVLRDPMRQTITFLHGHNLSIAAIAALMELHQGGDQSVSQLAADIGLSVAATSQLVEKLVQEKLVTRTESAEDRRRKQLALTTAGRRLLGKMEQSYTSAAERVFAGIPAHALRDLDAALAAVIASAPRRG